ncbi:MAG: sterol desaturase family protein [Bacteriovoracaceae bacterium]|jgi:sterol desaturase/sphingolipid hydroxylase (fatty acid hydroxylase superfamily)|nr:sterol desaturase family protein [Bacteriovoracaceae bacterium]
MIITFSIIFIAIFLRYLLFSIILEKLVKKKNKIINKKRSKELIKFEIKQSCITSLVFALGMSHLFHLWQNNVLIFKSEFNLLSQLIVLLVFLFIHDTYYYFLHRAMHTKVLYNFTHKAHHRSITTSGYTAFSFNFIEAFFQLLPIYIMILVLPFNFITLVIALIFMSISGTMNHINYEFYPKWLQKFFIGAHHHSLHHKKFKVNYGLYFTFWDIVLKTEHKKSPTL